MSFIRFIVSLVVFYLCMTISVSCYASSEGLPPKKHEWSFDGHFGKFDKKSIQRGFQVYKEVCSACHGLNKIAFRNLIDIGFSDAEIKALASSYTVKDGPNSDGEMFERPGRPSDYIPSPYPNEQAARAANNNAYPPDLSLMIKARHDGANYVYSILTGYAKPPAHFEVTTGMNYNPYFGNGNMQIAMPPPLHTEGQVQYADETKSTVEQMAHDVVNFLQWAAEPEMEERKSLGFKSLIFLTIFTGIFWLLKIRLWREVK